MFFNLTIIGVVFFKPDYLPTLNLWNWKYNSLIRIWNWGFFSKRNWLAVDGLLNDKGYNL